MLIRKLTKATVTLLGIFFCQLSFSLPGDIAPVSQTNASPHTLTINNVSGDGRVPTTPQGITYYDGKLWVVDFATDRIYRVYPNDVFDTDEVTVLFSAGDSDLNLPLTDANHPPINSDGTPIGSCASATPAGQYCGGGGITFAENFLWNASPITDDIIKIDPVDGDNLETENALASLQFPSPTDMAFDGSHFWVVDWQSNTINKVLPETGTIISSIPGPSTLPSYQSNPSVTNARPFGIAWDGQSLWISDQSELRIFRISPTDGSILRFFDTQGANPKGLTWDGEYLWHIDQTTQTIYKLESGVIPFGIEGCFLKNGVGIAGSDVLLTQNATSDQTVTTNDDGCFVFPSFVSGTPVQVQVSESGIDQKPVITLTGGDVTLLVNDSYIEPGYTAFDTEDLDITANVISIPDVINNPSLVDTSVANATGIIVAYDVIDTSGNNADTVYRTVYVEEIDETPPAIILNGNNPLGVEQGSIFSDPGATAIDARDGDITSDIVVIGSVDTNIPGLYTLSYNVSDTSGNAATTVSRSVVVSDSTMPLITLNGANPQTIEKGNTYSDPGANASDNIDGDISANVSTTGSVVTQTVGTYIISYNVSDTADNAATTVSRTVNVIDTTAPLITLIGGTPYNQELNTVFTDPGATALDAPSDDLSASISVVGSVNTSVTGIYTLTYNVSDTEGNTAASVIRDVVVSDTGAPTITLLGSNPYNQELGISYTDPGATANDASDGDITANIVIGGDTVNSSVIGIYNVTYNVSDSSSNAAPTQSRTIIVGDTTPPVIVLTGSSTVLHDLQAPYSDAGATASDNVDGDISANIILGGDTVDINTAGIYSVSYSVSDAAGNAAAPITRTIDIADRTAPVITLTGANPLNHEVGTIFVDPGASAADNIDGNLSANIGVSGTVDPNTLGTYTLTYNVSDASSNSAATITRTVNVIDTGAPAITLIGSNPILHELQTAFTDPGATASDAVDGDLSASIAVSGSVDSNTIGTYTLSYNVNDSQSNAATTETRDVIVADRAAPVITLLGSNTVNVEQGGTYTEAGATANDIIDGDVTAGILIGGDTVNTNTASTYTITYNARDLAGNFATQLSRTVIVSDTSLPVITLLGSNPMDHEIGTIFTDPGANAADSIDGDLTPSIGISGSVNPSAVGSYTLSYNVTDSSGNMASTVTRTVNVQDSGAPSIIILGGNPINHEISTSFVDPGATASDAIDGDLSSAIIIGGDAVNTALAGTYVITYDVSDSSSNPAAQQTRTVNVNDFTAPIITLSGSDPMSIELGAAFADPGASANDNIDGIITANIVVTGSVDSNTAGSYTLSYNVSDTAGNAATTLTRTINIADSAAPIITLNGDSTVNHQQGTIYTDAGATAIDSTDGDVSANISVTGSVNASIAGTYTLTYNVSDASSNPATALIRTVIVADTGLPTISLIGSSLVNVEQGAAFTDLGANASDTVDGDISASIVVSGDTVNTAATGTYIIRYNISDTAGNAAIEVTRTINVADTTVPVISMLGDNPQNVALGAAYSDPGATASDNIDGNINGSIVVSGAVDTNTIDSYTLNYNAVDAAGNNALTVTRTVIVGDSTAPAITLLGNNPVDVTVSTIFTDPGATAADNVDGDVTASITTSGAVDTNTIGTYTLSYNVADAAGNASATSRTVNVVSASASDTTPPTITLIGSDTVNIEQGDAYTDTGASASDDTDGDISGDIVVSGSVSTGVAGIYTLDYNVSDSAGNAATTLTRTITVSDTTNPIITLIGDNPINHQQNTAFNDPGFTANDSADGDVSASALVGGNTVLTNVPGTYIITYNARDDAGNFASEVTRTVNVADTAAPTIFLLGSNPTIIEQGTTYVESGASASDLVEGDLSSSISIAGSVATNTAGSYILSYSVSDTSGNTAITVTRTVIVQDTTAPTITLLGSSPITHEQGISYTDAGATASDLGVNITADIVATGSVNSSGAGSYTLSYNVIDAAGNAATTVSRVVNVVDTTIPTITVLGDDPYEVVQNNVYADPGASASDNIDGDISGDIVINSSGVDMATPGTYSVLFNVSDATGNAASTQSRSVTVIPLSKTFSASPGLSVGSSSVSTSMNITDDRQLADLNVIINLSHGRPGDIVLTLTSPSNTSLVIMDRPGTTGSFLDYGCANDNISATFDDEGSSAVENMCNSSPGIGGIVIPQNALSAFDGESSLGVWTLQVEDKATLSNTGTLNTWSLETIIQ